MVHVLRPKVALVGWPSGTGTEEGRTALGRRYEVTPFSFLTSWYGDRVTKYRRAALATSTTQAADLFFRTLRGMEVAVPESLEAVYLPVDAVAGDPDPRRSRVKWSGTAQARADPFAS